MKRRTILAGAGLAANAMPLPALMAGQTVRRLTMVTDWPEGPGVLPSPKRLAQAIAAASGGRISIEVSPAGAVVRPSETFDAVQAGLADTHIGYFEAKSPAFHFFFRLATRKAAPASPRERPCPPERDHRVTAHRPVRRPGDDTVDAVAHGAPRRRARRLFRRRGRACDDAGDAVAHAAPPTPSWPGLSRPSR